MQNEVGDAVELPYFCAVKVHRLMCLELQRIIDWVSQIFPAIEIARPGCTSGIKVLCSSRLAMEKAKLLIRHCSESSKLYLAITGDKILLRCERIQDSLDSCLSQIQTMVPSLVAIEISRIIDDLRAVTFTVETSEDEAGKVVLALLRRDLPASDSDTMLELKALKLAALRLHITSPTALLTEKRSINTLLEKIQGTDQKKRKILKYLLYLLRKYGNSIGGRQTFTDTLEPPQEFTCPLSKRLMHDPVIIANGQTFERVWIENWFNDGHETCPKTHRKLLNLSLTPNFGLKDLILRWCVERGITIPDPCSQLTSSSPCLQKYSSSISIASFGSSLNELRLQVSHISIRSSDTN